RSLPETQNLVGCLLNTVVIRSDVEPELDFDSFLSALREQVLAAHEHQEVPFDQIVERLAPRRDPHRTPLFDVLFVWQTARLERSHWPGLAVRTVDFEPPSAHFDLAWEIHEDGSRLAVSLEYRRSLFAPETV